tara:strand:+ start:3489 stop:3758 length:270 start_codon:yes stop_codon:yes gene_type:complete
MIAHSSDVLPVMCMVVGTVFVKEYHTIIITITINIYALITSKKPKIGEIKPETKAMYLIISFHKLIGKKIRECQKKVIKIFGIFIQNLY